MWHTRSVLLPLFIVLLLTVTDDPARLQQEAKSLVASTDTALARGDYASALRDAERAREVHERLGQQTDAAWDFNAIGLANLYLGRYPPALDAYQRALTLDRAAGDGDGEITRLNNIGNVHFMQGRYSDALALYDQALGAVDARASEKSRGRLRKMTISNLAVLQQRLGADERALDLYSQLEAAGTMQPAEEAQLLVNRGALYRRLGDPAKALELYRSAQQLFARAAHRDGEIGAWRNIGIVYALDLADYDRALEAFNTGLQLARASSNRRGEAQALLYRGEVLRRMDRNAEAGRDLEEARSVAQQAGLVEEQWKALYGVGRVLQARGDIAGARAAFEHAIHAIESVRSDIRTVALRSEFLADKRDVYDALIRLRLDERPIATADIFELLERSRARTWQDRLQVDAPSPSLAAVQQSLPTGTLVLEYWFGPSTIATLWMTRDASGVSAHDVTPADIRAVQEFSETIARPASEWRRGSAIVGALTLSQLPQTAGVEHLMVIADGPLALVPLESLTLPGTQTLLVERFDVSYLPSASYLIRRPAAPPRRWAWPWERELVAFGAPSVPSAYPLETRSLPPLPYAAEEVRRVAGELRGRSEMHLGADARKQFIVDGRLQSVPLIHFSTHAVADTRDPDRSRILLAPPSPGAAPDYLFLREVSDLDLTGVHMVTLSACETERGKIVRGEGVEGFSRALLVAGAATAVTTLWDVADRPGAEMMTQFYYSLGRGRPKAAALRDAKLQFLKSNLAWAHPHYWAGYVLTGDGQAPLPRVVPWAAIAAAAVVALVLATVALRLAMKARRSTILHHTAS